MESKRWVVALGAVSIPLLACIGACVGDDNAAPPASAVPEASVPDTATPPVPENDGGSVDATPDVALGADSACTVQATLLALGADAGGTAIANDFTCPDGLDLDASTATFDFTGTGFARAPQSRQLESAGDGGEGAYAMTDAGPLPDGGNVVAIAPGVHQFSSFDFEGSDSLYSSGDLTLDVSGPFTLGSSTTSPDLYVQGNLTIVASGPIVLDGILYVAGNVTIHQPTNAGITFGASLQGSLATGAVYSGYSNTAPPLTTISPGDIDIETRGAIAFPNGYMYSNGFGSGAQARSGDVTLRAYGDITLGGVYNADAGDGQRAYFYVGNPTCAVSSDAGACVTYGANGSMALLSEGTISFQYGSFVYAGNLSNGPTGGNLSLRAVGGVHVTGDSFLYAGFNGSVDIASQGDVTFDGDSYGYSGSGDGTVPTNFAVRAHNVSVTNESYLYAGGKAGSLSVDTTGDITVGPGIGGSSSDLYAGNATCAPGGALTLRAEGNIAITGGSYVYGGSSNSGSGCAAAAGGNATVTAGGTIDAPVPDAGTPPVNGGTGSPNGTIAVAAQSPVVVGVLDTQLEPFVSAVSGPMSPASTALLFGALGTTAPSSFFGAHLLVSTDGTSGAFLPVNHQVGKALAAGWRYEVLLAPRMFDPTAVDGLVVRVQ